MPAKINAALQYAVKLFSTALVVAATVLFTVFVYIGVLWAMGYTIQVKAVNYRDDAPRQESTEERPEEETKQTPATIKRVPGTTPTRDELRVTA